MSVTTRLRQRVKRQYTGSNIFEVIHPKTQIEDPTTLIRTEAQKTEAIFSDPSNALNPVEDDVQSDLDYAQRVYDAFSVDSEAANAVDLLTAAINSYDLGLVVRDDVDIRQDYFEDNLLLIIQKEYPAATVAGIYPRSNANQFALTLDALATYVGLTDFGAATDEELAQLIIDKIS